MRTLAQLTKRRAAFEEFLIARGAQILQPTNEWEVLRFKTKKGLSIVYRNKRDGLTPTGEADRAWFAFERGQPWNGATPTERKKRRAPDVAALIRRDGMSCFFCLATMTAEDCTVEHLVPRSHGGPNHLSNYVLAHRKCNEVAGSKSAMEKIRIREAHRP
jgi:hypothetical protein